MIRHILIGALSAIVCIVLYIPSKVAPTELTQLLRDEYAQAGELWGDEVANQVLVRTLKMQRTSASITTPVGAAPASSGPPNAVNAAMVAQFGQASARLFDNPYFRSIDALFALASFRLCAAIELLPVLLVFGVVVAADASLVRIVRSKELIAESAERFSVSLAVGILLGASVVIAWFLPFHIHLMMVLGILLAMLFVTSRAWANYHMMR